MIVLATFLPALLLANGGPVAWGSPMANGGIVPVQEKDIRLVSEDLTLTIEDSGTAYRARATYVLANPKAARAVTFGVPVVLSRPAEDEGWTDLTPKERAAVARAIDVEIGGKKVPCRIAESASGAIPPAAIRAGDEQQDGPTLGWCVTRLQVPSGASIPLTLAYRSDMEFTDMEFSKSALTSYGERVVRYPLYPAGFWAGTPEHLHIRVEPGRFDGLVSGGPKSTALTSFSRKAQATESASISSSQRMDGAALVWDWTCPGVEPSLTAMATPTVESRGDGRLPAAGPAAGSTAASPGPARTCPDLKALGTLTLRVDATPVLRHRQLASSHTERNLGEKTRVGATASSTLASQGKTRYDPSRAADGDAATAWCEGKPGNGEGEWLEVKLENAPAERCGLEGYALVPGYAKSDASYLGNNRLRRVRIGPCGGGAGGAVITLDPRLLPDGRKQASAELPLSSRYDRSAVMVLVSGEYGGVEGLDVQAACVRLTILEVEPGKVADTCLSEFRPVYNCG